ncbi:arylsulfatase [Rhodocytophaga rosea]|uniref:Arylsulfatase n=1 Tax=Rhodocytophaga rosea TaxID=2704465 RepID=A0A6C0GW55_9BACT|nr:arylsulfatase [Rhodocytophaga rosea]QHT71520.1 arylsulfatase [Rhodocytophaga rosea]
MRSLIILICILVLMAGTFSGCSRAHKQADTTQQPNIIIIMSDDQGWGDLSLSGNKNLHTPNIDLLAAKGVQFTHFYVSPVCSPTRAEFLTGRYHTRSGVYSTSEGGERINLDETTIAEAFKKAGYATAAYGKWHNGMQYPYHPNGRGFDEFYGFCSGHWGNYFSPLLEHNGKLVKGKGFIADDLTEKAMSFIDGNKSKPFFLYIPYNTPHSPMQVPDRWWNKFKDKELQMRAEDAEAEDINFTRAALAMCENIDWNVGRIINKLKEVNLEKNTIVVYLSDNGPNGWRWNGGMKGRKGSTDEGGIRSPLIILWPEKIAAGSHIEQIAGSIDLFPTLADLAGIPYQTPKPLDGVSLKPLLLQQSQSWNERLLFSHWDGRVSVRNEQYRLDHQGKLFNIRNDPGQEKDISAKEPQMAAQLRKAVESWKAEMLPNLTDDKRPLPVGHSDFNYTQLPARDGKPHGSIVRSNQYPNSSFFTNWKSLDDRITWEVEVLTTGNYTVEVYYTCPAKDVGSSFQLSFNQNKVAGKVTQAQEPSLIGMENDRVERMESYEQAFRSMKVGTIHLEKGRGNLTLQALQIPGSQVMDFRLLMLTRVN